MADPSDDGLTLRADEPLARHTAARTGGRCEAFVVVHRRAALAGVVAGCRTMGWPMRMLGAGTRVVVRDGPLRGAVVRLGGEFGELVHHGAGRWSVGAAVPVPAVVAATAEAGHAGLEALATVPGSVGASLALDLPWGEVADRVWFLRSGQIADGTWDETRGRPRILCGASLVLRPSDRASVRGAILTALAEGRPGHPSSWYAAPAKRTPRGAGVRALLASAELQLVRLRSVAIPDAAPELLVNLGEGTAADMALLHASALERVKAVRGVELRSRVLWLGAKSASA